MVFFLSLAFASTMCYCYNKNLDVLIEVLLGYFFLFWILLSLFFIQFVFFGSLVWCCCFLFMLRSSKTIFYTIFFVAVSCYKMPEIQRTNSFNNTSNIAPGMSMIQCSVSHQLHWLTLFVDWILSRFAAKWYANGGFFLFRLSKIR